MPEKNPTYKQLKEENQKLKNQLISFQERENKSRITLNSIGDGVITIDKNGLIKFMNPVAEQLTGWSENKAENRKLTEVFQIINANTREIVRNPVNKVLESGNIEWLATNTLLIANEGNEFQIGDSASPMRDKEENITGVVLVFRDLSEDFRLRGELETSEAELKASVEKLQKKNKALNEQKHELKIYKSMVEGSEDMMAALDHNHNYLCVNNAYLKYYQMHNNEVVGHNIKNVIGKKYYEETVKPNLDKCLTGEVVNFEMTRYYPRYGNISLDISYYPLKIDEDIGNVIAVMRDITHRKQVEKELINAKEKAEDSEKYFRLLIRNAPYAIFVQSDWKFAYINYEAMNLFGAEIEEELIGKPVMDRFHPDYHDNIKKRITKLNQKKQAQPNQEQIYLKLDGSQVNVEVTAVPFRYEGIDGALVFARNITDRKKAELQLQRKYKELETTEEKLKISNNELQNLNDRLKKQKLEMEKAKEKAEESDHLKSAFLANMSHEIRSPMNGIMGFSELLQEKDYPREKQKKFLDIINSRGKQLLQIINDIVDVSKIEANQLQLEYHRIYLNDIIQELHDIYQNELKSRGKEHITLKNHKDFEYKNSYIHTDSNRLRQIMDNLLNNAIKFTREGTIEFGYESWHNNSLLFYVKDSGSGIPNNQQKHIYERFRQVDDSTSKKHEGTGLGLTISKNLVELLGGKMWIKAEEGVGSEFYFTLPYGERPIAEKEESKETEKNLYNVEDKTLLLIEDDPSSLEYMKELLKPEGFNIISCETGQEGYEAFFNNPEIDLIFMDIKLPDINGLDVTRKIRNSSTNNKVSVIAQTAYAMSGDAQKSKDAGCDDYISKPIDKKELWEKIRKFT